MKRTGIFRIIKLSLFVVVLYSIFITISCITVNPETDTDLRHFHIIGGYFEEPTNTLDGVFIGASNVYTSWIPSLGWKKHGVAVRYFASSALGGDCLKTIIQNIYEDQPNALYIVCMTRFLASSSIGAKHDLFDYWPQFRKVQPVFSLYNEGLISSSEMTELSVPFIRFHDRWSQLKAEDFHHKFNGLKGDNVYPDFLERVADVSEKFYKSDKQKSLDPAQEKVLDDFLSYCEASNIKILFVGAPWAVSENEKEQLNFVNDVITRRGFDSINLSNYYNGIGLDSKCDYYDNWHTNIHGALKVTDYLSKYLLAHYDFPEKSGGGYESWDEAYDKYKEIITPYLTEEEWRSLP